MIIFYCNFNFYVFSGRNLLFKTSNISDNSHQPLNNTQIAAVFFDFGPSPASAICKLPDKTSRRSQLNLLKHCESLSTAPQNLIKSGLTPKESSLHKGFHNEPQMIAQPVSSSAKSSGSKSWKYMYISSACFGC